MTPTATVLEELTARLGDRVLADPDAMQAYRHDQCLLAEAGVPLAVVRARAVDDVVAVMELAQQTRTPVVVRGGGTGLAGAANAVDDGIVLDVSALDTIVEIDPAARTATVGPGVINADLDRAAAAHDLRYAPDPGSRAISTVGGNIATNAGGMCCTKYGVTADHVLALTAVLPGGEVVRTGTATRKDVAGLDLTRLIVGSEGTLAVVVEATVRLLPRPRATALLVASFATPAHAVAATVALVAETTPSAVELLDATTVAAVDAMTRMDLDETAGALLLVECDGTDAAAEAAACTDLVRRHDATEVVVSDDADEVAALWTARRVAYTALERLGTTLLDDVCVPVPELPGMLADIEAVAQTYGVTIGTFGHAADGKLHPTIVYDAQEEGAADRARGAFEAILAAALARGGTSTGEHGIGVLKTPFVGAQLGAAEVALMRRVKAAFDPYGVLNPGRAY